jgi:hypothetical protein
VVIGMIMDQWLGTAVAMEKKPAFLLQIQLFQLARILAMESVRASLFRHPPLETTAVLEIRHVKMRMWPLEIMPAMETSLVIALIPRPTVYKCQTENAIWMKMDIKHAVYRLIAPIAAVTRTNGTNHAGVPPEKLDPILAMDMMHVITFLPKSAVAAV